MKTLRLFPYGFRKLGYLLLVPFLALGIAFMGWDFTLSFLDYHPAAKGAFSFMNQNLTDEVATIGIIISLVLIGFSREKVEDEAIQFFRLEALQWAVYVNYAVLVLTVLFCYDGLFFTVMTINLFTVLIIFVLRFRYVLYRYNRSNP